MTDSPHPISKFLAAGRTSADLSTEDYRQLRITGTVQYIGAAIILCVLTVLPDPDHTDHVPFIVFALFAVVMAGMRMVAPERPGVVRASVVMGFVAIGVIVAISRPIGATPFFFLWPVLSTAYFLGRRDFVIATGAFTLALAGSLTVNPVGDVDAQMFLPTYAVVLIVGLLGLIVRERVDSLVDDLEYMTSIDVLTGLANRRTFADACEREIERSRRSQTPLALAIFNIDHFKSITARHGHAEGERALRRFADVLRNECRIVDVPARLRGEEFALILSNADAEGARSFSKRFNARLALFTRHDPAPLSCTVGITQAVGAGTTQDQLLEAADLALSQAKHRGPGQAVVADPAPPASTRQPTPPRITGDGASPARPASHDDPRRSDESAAA